MQLNFVGHFEIQCNKKTLLTSDSMNKFFLKSAASNQHLAKEPTPQEGPKHPNRRSRDSSADNWHLAKQFDYQRVFDVALRFDWIP